MGGVVKGLFVVVLLGVPLLVITQVPRLFDVFSAGSGGSAGTPTAFRLSEATPTNVRARFGSLDESPPPTLAPPATTPAPAATPRPTATGERIVIGNTGGVGAVLRAEPVTGSPVMSLREQQVLEVVERRNVPGSGDWVHVRTPDGREGWVIGLVALPVATANR